MFPPDNLPDAERTTEFHLAALAACHVNLDTFRVFLTTTREKRPPAGLSSLTAARLRRARSRRVAPPLPRALRGRPRRASRRRLAAAAIARARAAASFARRRRRRRRRRGESWSRGARATDRSTDRAPDAARRRRTADIGRRERSHQRR
eukprot:31415-Pelagococcus_subviridis.AAC.4